MRVCVEQAGAARAHHEELEVELGRLVTLGPGAGGHDRRQREAVEPLRDDDVLTVDQDIGHDEVGVVAEDLGEPALVGGLEVVVELLRHARLQLVRDRLDVDAGNPPAGDPGDPRELVEVAEQGLGRSGVLDLHGHVAPVAPHRPVHLPDGGSRRGGVVEGLELRRAPPRPELLGQYPVHHRRGEGRCGLLELREGRAVGAGELLGHRRLHHGERLPELHGTAFELAEDLEELLGRAGLELGRHRLGGLAAHPLAEADGGPPGEAQRQTGQPGCPADRSAGQFAHPAIVA